MTARVDSPSRWVDTAKLTLAILLIIAGIVGFYYFADKANIYRVLGMLGTVILAIALILTTKVGGDFASFLKESRIEVRKVVWPTRQETVQSTMVVVALVFIVGLVLWTLDAGLFWGVSLLTGQGK